VQSAALTLHAKVVRDAILQERVADPALDHVRKEHVHHFKDLHLYKGLIFLLSKQNRAQDARFPLQKRAHLLRMKRRKSEDSTNHPNILTAVTVMD
jgi:hypothetical protein